MTAAKRSTRFILSVGILAAAVVVAGITFISVEAGLLLSVFLGCAAFVGADMHRRRFWEHTVSFRMKKMSDDQAVLLRKAARNGHDVMTMRQDIRDLRTRQGRMEDLLDTGAHLAPPPGMKAEAPRDVPSVPRAVKPGQPTPETADDENEDLSDMIVRELVQHAIQNKRIELFVQPVVRLPQRKVRFYEVFARVRARAGFYLPATRYMPVAEQDKSTGEIDTMILMECLGIIRASAHVDRAAPLFLNITGATLRNPAFMKKLLGFIAENRGLAPRLVFEIPHADYKKLPAPMLEILRGIGKLGCSVSLDHVTGMDLDAATLQNHFVRFVKISANTMLPYTRSEKQRTEFIRLKRKLENNGISVIAEKVENEAMLRELLDFDIHYGQGYLFGKPDIQSAYRKRRVA